MYSNFTSKISIAIFIFSFTAIYGQTYRELPLAVTDSAGTDVNYSVGGGYAFPVNTLSDGFVYDPETPSASTPLQTFSTTETLHFIGLADAWVEYTLLTPTSMGAGLVFSFDIWGRSGATTSTRDDNFDIELYDETGTLFHTINTGITDDVTYYTRVTVTDADIDATTTLSSFIIRNTSGGGNFTLAEVRLAKTENSITANENLILEDTVYVCDATGTSYQISADASADSYSWTTFTASSIDLLDDRTIATPTFFWNDGDFVDDTISYVLDASFSGAIQRDTIVVITVESVSLLDADISSFCDGFTTGEEITLITNELSALSWSDPTGAAVIATASTDDSTTFSPLATGYYIVERDQYNGICRSSDSIKIDIDDATIGDTSVVGDYSWNGYVYNSNFTEYRGFFSYGDSSDLDLSSQDEDAGWGWKVHGEHINNSSLTNNNYIGCTSTNGGLHIVMNRKGFDCGIYSVSTIRRDLVSNGRLELYVNGNLVAYTIALQELETLWTGYLDENSTFEVRFDIQGPGTDFFGVFFEKLEQDDDEKADFIIEPNVDDYYICSGGSEIDIVSSVLGYTWTELSSNTNTHTATVSTNNDTLHFVTGDADTTIYTLSVQSCVNPSFSVLDTIRIISSDSALTEIVNFDNEGACVSSGVSQGTVSLEATGANSFSWTETSTNTLSATTGDMVEVSPSVNTTYTVEGTIYGSTCTIGKDKTSAEVEVSVFDIADGGPGDPSVFGDNQWIGYFYDQRNFVSTSYYGFYYPVEEEDNAGIVSTNDFNVFSNPSASTSYQGCSSTDGNSFSIAFRRKGFPCGTYNITLNHTRDDGSNNSLLILGSDASADTIIDVTPGTVASITEVSLSDESELTLLVEENTVDFEVYLTIEGDGVSNDVLLEYQNGNAALWQGTMGNGDWEDEGNWCGGRLPSSTLDVLIPADLGASAYPVIQTDDTEPSAFSLVNSGTITFAENASINIYNNFENDGTLIANTGSNIIFTGGAPAEIIGNPLSIDRITVNKTSSENTVSLTTDVTISDELNLTNGIVVSSSTASINIEDNASISNASTNSYVSGPLTKIGDEDFVFPVGKENIYAPITLSSTTDASTDEVTVEYFYENPTNLSTNHTTLQEQITRVSIVEYWNIDFGSNADTNYTVSLTWDNTERESGINTTNVLDMAYYDSDSLKWVFLETNLDGGSGYAMGSITTEAGQTLTKAGQVSFATTETSNILNPLPVTYMHFSAELINNAVQLRWVTSSEIRNNYFVIEVSNDAIVFDSLGVIKGAGNSTENLLYTYADDTYKNESTYYYRIRQVDHDGNSSLSKIMSISTNLRMDNGLSNELEVYPVPLKSGENLTIQYPNSNPNSIYSLRIVNQQGKEVLFQEINAKGMSLEELNILPNDLYFLHIETSEGTKVAKLVKTE